MQVTLLQTLLPPDVLMELALLYGTFGATMGKSTQIVVSGVTVVSDVAF